ncbi:hypothetical protein TNCV_2627591 [Trichonephila clavipes]|uniref:Uncharacterized protein n=1 Tax=Trichonephila clavipes TaxID=2585209 RepID=A0A8X6W7I0_TRICX|nr:hypothetical protein TNCV_2627591 [Trichonephila clavipes]
MGYDCLPNYLFRFGVLETPNRSICEEDVVLNAQHLLLCPTLSSYCISDRVVGYLNMRQTEHLTSTFAQASQGPRSKSGKQLTKVEMPGEIFCRSPGSTQNCRDLEEEECYFRLGG